MNEEGNEKEGDLTSEEKEDDEKEYISEDEGNLSENEDDEVTTIDPFEDQIDEVSDDPRRESGRTTQTFVPVEHTRWPYFNPRHHKRKS